jgi:hypothetical protein
VTDSPRPRPRKRERIRRSPSSAISALYVPQPAAVAVLPQRKRRSEGHPHALTGTDADLHRHPMPDKGATRIPRDSKVTKGHAEMVNQNLTVLAQERPDAVRGEDQIYSELIEQGVRPAFASMAAHQEIAAAMLSCGATLGEAADRAGVTEVTISKYWADQSFRRRVFELRSVVVDGINGRIVGELDRRTKGRNLQNMELMDVLRVFDRTNPKQSGSQRSVTTVAGNLSVTQLNYEGLSAEVRRVDTPEESADFPLLGPGSPAVAE